MRYLNRHRYSRNAAERATDDPLAGVDNLFDASVVFIAAMMLAVRQIPKTASEKPQDRFRIGALETNRANVHCEGR